MALKQIDLGPVELNRVELLRFCPPTPDTSSLPQIRSCREDEVAPLRTQGEELGDKLEAVRSALQLARGARNRAQSVSKLDLSLGSSGPASLRSPGSRSLGGGEQRGVHQLGGEERGSQLQLGGGEPPPYDYSQAWGDTQT